MSYQNVLIFGLIAGIAVLLISNRLRPDLVAILALVFLGLTGLVAPRELFSGFSRSAVITVLSLFIITAGLERTGVTRLLGRQLGRVAGNSEGRAVIVIMAATALLSLVMNTIAAAAVLLPVVIGITRQTDLRPSKLLIPLSFASLLGGMATLLTTSNILVSAALVDAGYRPYGILDFIPVGMPMALTGIAFMALVGRRWLPDHSLGGQRVATRRGSLSETYGLQDSVQSVYIKSGSALGGRSILEGGWGQRLALNVVAISRGRTVILAPAPSERVLEGDVVLFTGTPDESELARHGLILTDDRAWKGQLVSGEVSLVELVLSPRSPYAGKTLRKIKFRERFDLTVLAFWREGQTIQVGVGDIPLRSGDALLVQGPHNRIQLLRDDPNFIVLEEEVGEAELSARGWIALGLTLGAVLLSALNVLPIAEATFGAATMMVLFGNLSMDDAYSAVEWRAIFLIAGMLPLGLAMTTSGTAELVGNSLVSLLGQWGTLAVATGIFLVTMLLTQIMSGQATAVVVAPIAIAAAETLGVDPRGMGMAVALACSMAFLTPFGHPSNILVMGPGGYTLRDYARVGIPLTGVLFIVFLLALHLFWGI